MDIDVDANLNTNVNVDIYINVYVDTNANANVDTNKINYIKLNIIALERKILKTEDRFIKLLLIDELNNIKKKIVNK